MSSLSRPTVCGPRFTFVSDGYPLRRLLIRSKAERVEFAEVVEFVKVIHDEPPVRERMYQAP